MKTRIVIAFLVIMLASCAPALALAPTETSVPPTPTSPTYTPVPPPPLLTSALIPATDIPTPYSTRLPTPTIIVITPDPIQVERWKEYETALAKSLLSFLPPEKVLCEWEILGRSAQEVYVWAVCTGVSSGVSVPVVIHLEADGAIQSVEWPQNWSVDILNLFPADVRGKFSYYDSGRAKKMSEHIDWRRTHPEEPPLIVLSATPTP